MEICLYVVFFMSVTVIPKWSDLRDAYKEKKGSAFSLKAFHQKVLEIGPAPFPVVSKYLLGK